MFLQKTKQKVSNLSHKLTTTEMNLIILRVLKSVTDKKTENSKREMMMKVLEIMKLLMPSRKMKLK
jgi:hypothetical protein